MSCLPAIENSVFSVAHLVLFTLLDKFLQYVPSCKSVKLAGTFLSSQGLGAGAYLLHSSLSYLVCPLSLYGVFFSFKILDIVLITP